MVVPETHTDRQAHIIQGGGDTVSGKGMLAIVVEGSVVIPALFPPVGEIVSAKVGVEFEGQERLTSGAIRVVRGHLLAAITYSSAETPPKLTYLKLNLPFAQYIQQRSARFSGARVLHSVVDTQHPHSLYYTASVLLEGTDAK
jgi:hypothetical protein